MSPAVSMCRFNRWTCNVASGARALGWARGRRSWRFPATMFLMIICSLSGCSHGPNLGALAASPCPNWMKMAGRERGSLAVPGDRDVHDREYFVEVDSAVTDRGCFADSLALAVGGRVNWVYQHLPAFTISHLPDSNVARVRRTPHVLSVTRTVNFQIRDTIYKVP
jgi:hypothetical protein